MSQTSHPGLLRHLGRLGHLGMACAALVLSACGGGSSSGTAPANPSLSASALRTAEPGEIAAYFQARMGQRLAQGMASTEILRTDMIAVSAPGTVGTVTAADASAGSSAGSGFAGTYLQEAGVDEDDLLKTDGKVLYALHMPYYDSATRANTVPRISASRIEADGKLTATGTATLDPAFPPQGMYLVNGRLAVLGQGWGQGWGQGDLRIMDTAGNPTVSLDLFQAGTGSTGPARSAHVELDGALVASRRIGSVLYVATRWMPDVSIYRLPAGAAPAEVQKATADMSSGSLLPKVRVDGGAAQPLVAETDCMLQPGNASLSLQLTTLTAIDLDSPTLERRSRCFVGDAGTLYMSPTHAYFASSRNYWLAGITSQSILPQQASTDIHKFALNGLSIAYRGSGEVAGHLGWDPEKAPYRMSEYNGDLRVVSFTGETGWFGLPLVPVDIAPADGVIRVGVAATQIPASPPSPATLTVLREDPAQQALVTIGKLPNAQRPAPLGREGEQVYAVQFAGPLAYVVTFRRTDPLYVLDLSSPADPRAVGELKVTGFSDYLFPLGQGLLLGVGREASDAGRVQGLKMALFDVRDPSQPRELSSRKLGEAGSMSGLDLSRHALNLYAEGSTVRIALPVRLTASGPAGPLPTVQGLARFTVDTSAGTLAERAMVPATDFPAAGADWQLWARYDLSAERAVQTRLATYYLTGGQVRTTLE